MKDEDTIGEDIVLLTLEILVSTMHQTDYSLLDRMNISSNAVIVNQCDEDSLKIISYNGFTVKWINTTERGVGRSRNRCMIASSADILLFADDDVVYDDDAILKIIRFFQNNDSVSLVTFNLLSLNPKRPETIVKNDYRLNFFNCLKFGAFRIAVKRNAVLKNNIFFSLLFGGGASYQAGEDNLFITQCLQNGLKCVASHEKLGTVAQEQSTWFVGYNEKYYFDRGALFSAMYHRWAKVMLCVFELKHVDRYLFKRLKQETKGINDYLKS